MTFQGSKRLISVADYHKMAEVGILPERGIELINGEIIEMSPIGSKHLSCVNTLAELLHEALGRSVIISVQNPVQLNNQSEPEPDIAILKRSSGRYADRIPTADDAMLLIEVADTTLAYDRDVKLAIYAESGVPEFWLVNLEDQTIEAHWEPIGKAYRHRMLLCPGDFVKAQHFELNLAVAEILL